MAKIFIYHYLYTFRIVYFLLFYFILKKYYAPFYLYGTLRIDGIVIKI